MHTFVLAFALHNMINNNCKFPEKAAWANDVLVVQVKFCLTGKPAKQAFAQSKDVNLWYQPEQERGVQLLLVRICMLMVTEPSQILFSHLVHGQKCDLIL